MQFGKAQLSYKLARLGFSLALYVFAATMLRADSATSDAQGLFRTGSKQFIQHNFAAARESFTRSIQLDGSNAQAYRALGMTEVELKDYEAAYRAWLKAVTLDPNDEKSKYFLGRLFYEADLVNEAAAWLREALKLAPNDFEARTYLGLCAEALGYGDTALQLFRRAVAESGEQGKPYAKAYLSLGNCLRKHGDENRALSVLEEGAQKCPEAHELTALGELLRRCQQPQRAEEMLRRAVALDPMLSEAHYSLGLLLKSLGRDEESRREMTIFQETKAEEDSKPRITALRKQAVP